MNWYIGQQIVAIVDHPDGFYKKDCVYVIYNIKDSSCLCPGKDFDIGVIWEESTGFICDVCNYETLHLPIKNMIAWFHESDFAPLLSQEQEEELNDVIQNLIAIEA